MSLILNLRAEIVTLRMRQNEIEIEMITTKDSSLQCSFNVAYQSVTYTTHYRASNLMSSPINTINVKVTSLFLQHSILFFFGFHFYCVRLFMSIADSMF